MLYLCLFTAGKQREATVQYWSYTVSWLKKKETNVLKKKYFSIIVLVDVSHYMYSIIRYNLDFLYYLFFHLDSAVVSCLVISKQWSSKPWGLHSYEKTMWYKLGGSLIWLANCNPNTRSITYENPSLVGSLLLLLLLWSSSCLEEFENMIISQSEISKITYFLYTEQQPMGRLTRRFFYK